MNQVNVLVPEAPVEVPVEVPVGVTPEVIRLLRNGSSRQKYRITAKGKTLAVLREVS